MHRSFSVSPSPSRSYVLFSPSRCGPKLTGLKTPCVRLPSTTLRPLFLHAVCVGEKSDAIVTPTYALYYYDTALDSYSSTCGVPGTAHMYTVMSEVSMFRRHDRNCRCPPVSVCVPPNKLPPKRIESLRKSLGCEQCSVGSSFPWAEEQGISEQAPGSRMVVRGHGWMACSVVYVGILVSGRRTAMAASWNPEDASPQLPPDSLKIAICTLES
ncbi:hypothetical protein OH76DRAFT_522219 [Lentinus brumalis]|uniref:Uncharacterized protein n=1 Tax=Lentinus brumalis TaxID=2498619 RepID=A0A371DAS5_9APHY|nr:hypothetical protein OH76DRAFT_522219 [Polyporus brumalis]